MNSMIYRYGMITVSAVALLAGCAAGDQAPLLVVPGDHHAVSAASGEANVSGSFFTETHYFPYEKGALYQLRAAVGSASTIELQSGETLINYALADGSLWIVDDVDGANQTLLQVKPTQPDLNTHLLINTDKRSYLVEATSHQGDDDEAALAWTYPHEQVDQKITAVARQEGERPGETTVTPAKSYSFSWSRWFAGLSKTSSSGLRGCKLCRDPDDHGDHNGGRDHDAADHHGKS